MSKLTDKDQIHINQLIETAKEYNNANNFQQALNFLIQAWDDLPEPKEEFIDGYSIVKYIIQVCLKYKASSEAKKWVDKIYLCDKNRFDGGETEYLHGRVEYESRNFNEAAILFKTAFQKSEGRLPRHGEKEFLKLLTSV